MIMAGSRVSVYLNANANYDKSGRAIRFLFAYSAISGIFSLLSRDSGAEYTGVNKRSVTAACIEGVNVGKFNE